MNPETAQMPFDRLWVVQYGHTTSLAGVDTFTNIIHLERQVSKNSAF